MKKFLKGLKKVVSFSLLIISLLCLVVVGCIAFIICWPLYLIGFSAIILRAIIDGEIKITKNKDENKYDYNTEIEIG